MENNDSNVIVEQLQANMQYVKARSRLGLILLVPLMVFLVAFLGHSMWQSHEYSAENEVSCDRILDCLDQGRAEEALLMAKQIIESCPDYYYAHSCLADAYLANGDVSNALKHATMAFEFYPSESMEEELQIIRKRVENESSK